MNKTNEQKEPANNALMDEQLVVEYLTATPEFFEHNPELLKQLVLPPAQGERVVSLFERQAEVLREDNQRLEDQLERLMKAASGNEKLQQSLHQFSLELIGLDNIDIALKAIPQLLQQHFELTQAVVKLTSKSTNKQQETDLETLLNRVAHKKSICDDRLPRQTLDYLFASEKHHEDNSIVADSANQQEMRVGSCALLPLLNNSELQGVVALGAEDAERFAPNIGTLFLDRLSELISAVFVRVLR